MQFLSRENFFSFLLCSTHPYFLERESLWFEKNLEKILNARKTQIFWQENTFFIQKDQKISLSQFLKKLDEMGYEKVWEVENIGEFAQRGGIVDVFPINSRFPIRIEFSGNKIELIEKIPLFVEEKKAKEILKKKLKWQQNFSDLKNLKPGEYLVHLDHGIGKFLGFKELEIAKKKERYFEIEYQNKDKLYVPITLSKKLARYIGFRKPKISKLGSLFWIKTKKKVKEEVKKFAKELLKIFEKRKTAKKTPYLPDDEFEQYLKESFPFEETPDQQKAWQDIKKDLESERPMERLLCGDVGFGKTEIALRAMVKVAKSGYQAVMLCPTTILANQHYQNFKKRLQGLPIKLAMLSRFVPKKEQKKILKELKEGKIDILVGTHIILSEKVSFKRLGLLVIDDEHKFGVWHKEKLKKLKENIDVLSMSATPIPRTLYLALSSFLDISFIQTPPPGRFPIKTFILPFGKEIIKKAIEKELERGGQVYYLHNKIENILAVEKFLKELLPKVKIGIGHGKLKEKELVKIMDDFQNKKIDVLVATTIIEAGLDLPNVNTLIVADATKLGLSQAYQIRGRVGRSHLQAFAYFLYPQRLTPLAKERLKALKEAEKLGSGYKIALKDLELRGAGNILGK
ncbi:DEAD/DEAH box helicase, partial [Candidatus Parcubacteria bacterium]|nr:DEAD/DEAH box helicase [Candidatus Parcubacteria bacterium]